MTTKEAEQQQARISNFNLLAAARSALISTREKMGEQSGEEGTVKSLTGPFTGNTRESRKISWMKIGFTGTLGGEPPVELHLGYLSIAASPLGIAIEDLIDKRLAQINAEIERL